MKKQNRVRPTAHCARHDMTRVIKYNTNRSHEIKDWYDTSTLSGLLWAVIIILFYRLFVRASRPFVFKHTNALKVAIRFNHRFHDETVVNEDAWEWRKWSPG